MSWIAAVDVAADVVRVVRLHRAGRMRRAGAGSGRGSPARSARPGPRSGRSCRPSSRRARGSRPRRSSGRRAPGSGPTARTGRTACTAGPGGGRRRRRPRTAAISSSVPPRWTVRRPARALGGPRDRPVERPVDLEDPRPVAEPLGTAAGPRRAAGRRRSPRSWRGVDVEQRRPAPAAAPSSDADPAARHDLAAGVDSSSATSASATALAAAADHRPADGVGERRQDQPERGTQRAIEAEHRVGGDPGEQGPGRLVAEPCRGPGPSPTAAPAARTGPCASGWRGDVDDRPEQLLRPSLRRVADERPEQPRARPARRRRRDPRRSRATDRSRTAARPPSSGCATGASGGCSSTPRAARSIVRKNGDAIVSGTIVEQTSWRNPGSVSSAVRVPPPAVGAAS